jgi:hypothetical protein
LCEISASRGFRGLQSWHRAAADLVHVLLAASLQDPLLLVARHCFPPASILPREPFKPVRVLRIAASECKHRIGETIGPFAGRADPDNHRSVTSLLQRKTLVGKNGGFVQGPHPDRSSFGRVA